MSEMLIYAGPGKNYLRFDPVKKDYFPISDEENAKILEEDSELWRAAFREIAYRLLPEFGGYPKPEGLVAFCAPGAEPLS